MLARTSTAWVLYGLTAWSAREPCSAQSGTTTRVSLGAAGLEGDAESFAQSLSADGRFVAFASLATNLVPGDTNEAMDVFVHDRSSAVTTRVSVAASGVEGDEFSCNASISADGRLVVFRSFASNLVAGDTNSATDVFVHDRATGTIELVDVSSSGDLADFGSAPGAISGNGRFVVFASPGTNLVGGDSNARIDVFVRDLLAGTTERASVDSSGAQGDGSCWYPCISSDGLQIAFVSEATNLVAGDGNGARDVFLRDRASGLTTRVSVDTGGLQADSESTRPSLSGDGRFVAFESFATNLVGGDTNSLSDVFLRDRLLATTVRVSVDTAGNQADGSSAGAALSADGRCVAFVSQAANLLPGDGNARADCFVRELASGALERVSLGSAGTEADGDSSDVALSADGRSAAFTSGGAYLVASDSNGCSDAFVRERALAPANYCTAGTTALGCSVTITVSANPSVSHAHSCSITTSGVPGQTICTFFYGVTGRVALPWCSSSTSTMCVRGPRQRTGFKSSSGSSQACDGVLALDWYAYQSAHPLALGNPWLAGDPVNLQAWFRDPPACKSSGLSNAVELTYEL